MKLINYLSIVVFVVIIESINGQLPDANIKSDQLDGASVLRMGRQFRNPLLRLLGTAMRNSKMDVLDKICSLYRCGEWSEWSPCPVEAREHFGMITRSRECGKGPSFCKSNPSQIIRKEMDSKVCMGNKCPADFTKTDNGFCFLLHNTKMNRDDAGKLCEDKGGFVINPYSKIKSHDLHNFLSTEGKSREWIWLDARRKDHVSPWEYSYGMGPGNYTNWNTGQPNHMKNEFCKAEGNLRTWYDVACSNTHFTVCEIP